MKIGIVQPYFFPYIGYFQLIYSVDKFIVFDDVNFMKKKWINRNQILIGGQASFITIPLKKVSQNKLISDIEIVNDEKWKLKLLAGVRSAYGRAPMFESIYTLVEDVLNKNHTHISGLATESLKIVCKYLRIQTNFVESSAVYLNSHLKAQERILDICRQENAGEYFNPIGGTELYSREAFEAKGVKLHFVKPYPGNYRQFQNDFVPFLSIIDVLMFNPREIILQFINKRQLI